MRVTSGSWDGEKVVLKGQVLKVCSRRCGAKNQGPDDWDPPMPVYDHMALACRATMMCRHSPDGGRTYRELVQEAMRRGLMSPTPLPPGMDCVTTGDED